MSGTGLSLITGGAGFVGSNLAYRLLSQGQTVRIFDNLARPGAELNLLWLRGEFGERLELVRGDVRDAEQVRDVLFIDDLLDAYQLAVSKAGKLSGQVFNIGGGPDNTLSLLELVALLEEHLGRSLDVSFDAWRPGDQRVYVSDTRRAERQLGWTPSVTVDEGVERLIGWVLENDELFHGQR